MSVDGNKIVMYYNSITDKYMYENEHGFFNSPFSNEFHNIILGCNSRDSKDEYARAILYKINSIVDPLLNGESAVRMNVIDREEIKKKPKRRRKKKQD